VQDKPERGCSEAAETVAARIEVAMIEENILRLREVCEIDGED